MRPNYNPETLRAFREEYKHLSGQSFSSTSSSIHSTNSANSTIPRSPLRRRLPSFPFIFISKSRTKTSDSLSSKNNDKIDFRNMPVFDDEPSGLVRKVKREVKDTWKWYTKEKREVEKLRMRNVDWQREEKVLAAESGGVWGRRCLSFD